MSLLAKSRTFLLGKLIGIERHEYAAVAWSFVYFFCVLSSYYMIRPIRETMATVSGSETIPYLFFGTFMATMLVTPVFGALTSRYPRRKFLPWVYAFFISNILIFFVLFSQTSDPDDTPAWLARAFFVWTSVFNLFVVSVFWSFMADIYTREQGRRLFGFITSGGSIGALLGGLVTSALVTEIGFYKIFPISAAILSIAFLCIRKLRTWAVHDRAADNSGEALGGTAWSGLTHVVHSRYFLAISFSSVMASLLGTALYMFAAQLIEQEIGGVNERTQFFSNMNNVQNLLAPIMQMFLVRQVVQRSGLRMSLALMPAISIAGFVALAMSPVLGVVAFLTVARRAIGFGFMKPSTDMLYSVVTREEKYKAKNFIDTAIYRGGDLFGTWTIKGLLALGLGMTGVSIVMLPFAVLWTWVAWWLGNDYRRQARELKQRGVT